MNTLTHIYTAHYRYSGLNKVDITVKGNHPIWGQFKPTWDMVMGVKNGTLSQDDYVTQYLDILQHRISLATWEELFSLDKAVFVCFCPKDAFCHRNILVRFICNTLGSRIIYGGWKQ